MNNMTKIEDMATKEMKEKRKEAKEIKKAKKNPPRGGAQARACACVREEAAADPSGPDAKSAAAAKREKDELIRENYRLETELRRARRCLRVWYVALRKHKEEIAVLRRVEDVLRRNKETWNKANKAFGDMSVLAKACKVFSDNFNAIQSDETEGGAK